MDDQGDRQGLQRCSMQRDSLRGIEKLPRGTEIVAHMRPELVAEVESGAPAGWAPVALDVEMTESVAAVLGKGGARDAARTAMLDIFEGPLLGPLVRGTLRVFGIGPRGLTRVLVMMWDRVYRDCGRIEVEPADGSELRVWLREPVAVVFESDAYVDGIAGTVQALLDMSRVDGAVTWSREGSDVRLVLRWKTPE